MTSVSTSVRPNSYAGPISRGLAALIDGFIMGLPLFLPPFLQLESLTARRFLALLCVLFVMAYPIFFHGRYGATPGKKLMGLRVTKLGGSAIGYKEAFMRKSVDLGIFCIFMGMISLDFISAQGLVTVLGLNLEDVRWSDLAGGVYDVWFWSNVVFIFFHAKHRAIHDVIAGTVVLESDVAF